MNIESIANALQLPAPLHLQERQLMVMIGEHLTTPFTVKILWGSHPKDDAPICEYRFATEAELDAFMVQKLIVAIVAEGWMDFTVVE